MEVTRTGLTGWLTPWGEFLECKYGSHSDYARYVLDLKYGYADATQLLLIPMGSMGCGFGNLSYIHIPCPKNPSDPQPKFTEAQVAWLKDNYHKLDEEQQSYLDTQGGVAGWNPLGRDA